MGSVQSQIILRLWEQRNCSRHLIDVWSFICGDVTWICSSMHPHGAGRWRTGLAGLSLSFVQSLNIAPVHVSLATRSKDFWKCKESEICGSVDVLKPSLRFKQFFLDFDERLDLLTELNKDNRVKVGQHRKWKSGRWKRNSQSWRRKFLSEWTEHPTWHPKLTIKVRVKMDRNYEKVWMQNWKQLKTVNSGCG